MMRMHSCVSTPPPPLQLGSAAGRHLAEAGLDVVVLGSKTLTSSSHDRGRIARGMDAEGNKAWARRNSESLQGFR